MSAPLTEEMEAVIEKLEQMKYFSLARVARQSFERSRFWGGPDARTGVKGIDRLLARANKSGKGKS